MVQALRDAEAGVTVFPFGNLRCSLLIGPVPTESQEFSGRTMAAIAQDEMPQQGVLLRCSEHGAFLVLGLTQKSQVRCEETRLVIPSGEISLPQEAALGKRYVDPPTGLEILCIKKGEVPSCGGRLMWEMLPKVLPSAD